MTILLSDPRVAAVPVRDIDEPLVVFDSGFGSGQTLVRSELATRLESARSALPSGIGLRVVEGYRPAHRQQAIIERYSAEIRAARPGIGEPELHILTSRYVAPLAVAPHVAAGLSM
jgi:zinc D-Ala-D-Ala dipeptidase